MLVLILFENWNNQTVIKILDESFLINLIHFLTECFKLKLSEILFTQELQELSVSVYYEQIVGLVIMCISKMLLIIRFFVKPGSFFVLYAITDRSLLFWRDSDGSGSSLLSRRKTSRTHVILLLVSIFMLFAVRLVSCQTFMDEFVQSLSLVFFFCVLFALFWHGTVDG